MLDHFPDSIKLQKVLTSIVLICFVFFEGIYAFESLFSLFGIRLHDAAIVAACSKLHFKSTRLTFRPPRPDDFNRHDAIYSKADLHHDRIYTYTYMYIHIHSCTYIHIHVHTSSFLLFSHQSEVIKANKGRPLWPLPFSVS